MNKSSKIRVGLIGAGRIGTLHIETPRPEYTRS